LIKFSEYKFKRRASENIYKNIDYYNKRRRVKRQEIANIINKVSKGIFMKEIQEKRMRGYFIESAKTLIRGEGVHSVSARTVAEGAGYSYATLYNYFSDMKQLIACCVHEFIVECEEYIRVNSKAQDDANKEIIAKAKNFAQFFIQYPGIFAAVFTENIPELRSQEQISVDLNNLFENVFNEQFKMVFGDENYELRIEIMKNYLFGALDMYLFRRAPSDYSKFIQNLENGITFTLNSKI
jgi:AcrR family transcriptional regulator